MSEQSTVAVFETKVNRISLQSNWHKFLDTTIQSDAPTDEDRYGEIKE